MSLRAIPSSTPAVRLGAGVVLCVAAVLALAGPAAAHTALVVSTPADGSTVTELSTLDLRFTEPIEVAASHVWVRDAAGYLELAPPTLIDGDVRSMRAVVPKLGDGDYEVTWHAMAQDGNTVEGTFTFHLRSPVVAAPPTSLDPAADPPPDTSLAVELDTITGTSPPPALAEHGHGPSDVTRGLARGVLDTSVAVLIGGFAFVAVVWPAGGRAFRTRQLLWAAAGGGAIASVELSAFQLASLNGTSAFAALVPTAQLAALDFHFGRVAAARLVLVVASVVAIAALARPGRRTPSRWWLAAVAVVVVGLAETLVLLGHASSALSVAGLARLTHVLGVSAWVGGLVMLLVVVLPRRKVDELTQVLPRFSRFATGAIAVLVLGGALLAVDLVGSPAALLDSGYGRVLVAKLVLVGLLLMAASLSRAHVRQSLQAKALSGAAIVRPLFLWAGVEVGLMAGVFAVTAVLVSRVPPA